MIIVHNNHLKNQIIINLHKTIKMNHIEFI
jgi:hypothetical protein